MNKAALFREQRSNFCKLQLGSDDGQTVCAADQRDIDAQSTRENVKRTISVLLSIVSIS